MRVDRNVELMDLRIVASSSLRMETHSVNEVGQFHSRRSAELAQHAGARAGSRTLTLGIKSHLTLRLLASQGVSGRLSKNSNLDATVSCRLLVCHGVSWRRCQRRSTAGRPASPGFAVPARFIEPRRGCLPRGSNLTHGVRPTQTSDETCHDSARKIADNRQLILAPRH